MLLPCLVPCAQPSTVYSCAVHAGICSDRFARHNHDVKLKLAKAQHSLDGSANSLASFEHCMAFLLQLRVNQLCVKAGAQPVFPFLDPAILKDPGRGLVEDREDTDKEGEKKGRKALSPEKGTGETSSLLGVPVAANELPADWDENLLEEGGGWSEAEGGEDEAEEPGASAAAADGQLQHHWWRPGKTEEMQQRATPSVGLPETSGAAAPSAVLRQGPAAVAAATIPQIFQQQQQPGQGDEEDTMATLQWCDEVERAHMLKKAAAMQVEGGMQSSQGAALGRVGVGQAKAGMVQGSGRKPRQSQGDVHGWAGEGLAGEGGGPGGLIPQGSSPESPADRSALRRGASAGVNLALAAVATGGMPAGPESSPGAKRQRISASQVVAIHSAVEQGPTQAVAGGVGIVPDVPSLKGGSPSGRQQSSKKQQWPEWMDVCSTSSHIKRPETPAEEQLFVELLPGFIIISSSSNNNMWQANINSVNWKQLADAYNMGIKERLEKGVEGQHSYSHAALLKAYFKARVKEGKARARDVSLGDALSRGAHIAAAATTAVAAPGPAELQKGESACLPLLGRQQQAAGQAPNAFATLVGLAAAETRRGPVKGKGLGGKGGIKSCVPCSMKKFDLASPADVQKLSNPVGMKDHRNCPFCKCEDCKREFSKRGKVDWRTFLQVDQCRKSKRKRNVG